MQMETMPSDGNEVQFVEANGLRFGFLEMGEGPLALLVHGFPDTPYGFADLMKPLANAGYRVVAPFTRGYSPTALPPTQATTLEELAADVLALIPALGSKSAVLVGHDWGAATAYLAAALEPDRVDKVVAIAIPHPAAIRPSLALLWQARHFVTLRLPGALQRVRRNNFARIDAFYRRWSPTWDFSPSETDAVKACYAQPGCLDAAIGYYRGARPGHVNPSLRKPIVVPTLAIAGDDDPALSVADYQGAKRRFSGGYEVVSFPGGHFVHRESPSGVRDAIVHFLSR